jgi:hypothetical protein
LEFSGSAVWVFAGGEVLGVVWEQLSYASGEGEYSGLVSAGVCDSDEAASDGGLSEVGIYFTVGFDSDAGEV